MVVAAVTASDEGAVGAEGDGVDATGALSKLKALHLLSGFRIP